MSIKTYSMRTPVGGLISWGLFSTIPALIRYGIIKIFED